MELEINANLGELFPKDKAKKREEAVAGLQSLPRELKKKNIIENYDAHTVEFYHHYIKKYKELVAGLSFELGFPNIPIIPDQAPESHRKAVMEFVKKKNMYNY